MSRQDGGQVFPTEVQFQDGTTGTALGISLRDYFAAKAMAALIHEASQNLSVSTITEVVARLSFEFADAMIRAREAFSDGCGVQGAEG